MSTDQPTQSDFHPGDPGTAQYRPVLPLIRSSRHHRSTSVLLAAALCIAAAPGAVLAQGPAPSVAASPGATATARPMPLDAGTLFPGRYVSAVGTGTSVSFDVVDDAWTGSGGGMLVMDRDVAGDGGELIVTTFHSTRPDPCDRQLDVTEREVMDAKTFTDWLVAQPWATATAHPTTLGGEPAIAVDISAIASACGDEWLFTWLYLTGGPYRLFPTEAVRVITQDRDGELILVTAETEHAASLPAFLESAMPLIDSMTFGGPIAQP